MGKQINIRIDDDLAFKLAVSSINVSEACRDGLNLHLGLLNTEEAVNQRIVQEDKRHKATIKWLNGLKKSFEQKKIEEQKIEMERVKKRKEYMQYQKQELKELEFKLERLLETKKKGGYVTEKEIDKLKAEIDKKLGVRRPTTSRKIKRS